MQTPNCKLVEGVDAQQVGTNTRSNGVDLSLFRVTKTAIMSSGSPPSDATRLLQRLADRFDRFYTNGVPAVRRDLCSGAHDILDTVASNLRANGCLQGVKTVVTDTIPTMCSGRGDLARMVASAFCSSVDTFVREEEKYALRLALFSYMVCLFVDEHDFLRHVASPSSSNSNARQFNPCRELFVDRKIKIPRMDQDVWDLVVSMVLRSVPQDTRFCTPRNLKDRNLKDSVASRLDEDDFLPNGSGLTYIPNTSPLFCAKVHIGQDRNMTKIALRANCMRDTVSRKVEVLKTQIEGCTDLTTWVKLYVELITFLMSHSRSIHKLCQESERIMIPTCCSAKSSDDDGEDHDVGTHNKRRKTMELLE